MRELTQTKTVNGGDLALERASEERTLADLQTRQDAEIAAFMLLPRREQIVNLIADLMANGDRTPPPVKHTLIDDMYVRELFICKGMALAGVMHRHACINFCKRGDIDILTERGLVRARAGFMAVSQPLTQKLGYAYEDTVWVNVFRIDKNKTDIEEIEREIFLSKEEMVAQIDPLRQYFKQN